MSQLHCLSSSWWPSDRSGVNSQQHYGAFLCHNRTQDQWQRQSRIYIVDSRSCAECLVTRIYPFKSFRWVSELSVGLRRRSGVKRRPCSVSVCWLVDDTVKYIHTVVNGMHISLRSGHLVAGHRWAERFAEKRSEAHRQVSADVQANAASVRRDVVARCVRASSLVWRRRRSATNTVCMAPWRRSTLQKSARTSSLFGMSVFFLQLGDIRYVSNSHLGDKWTKRHVRSSVYLLVRCVCHVCPSYKGN